MDLNRIRYVFIRYLFEDEIQHQRIVEAVFGIKNL